MQKTGSQAESVQIKKEKGLKSTMQSKKKRKKGDRTLEKSNNKKSKQALHISIEMNHPTDKP